MMNYLHFGSDGFNSSDDFVFKEAWKLLSDEGKESFEKLLNEYDHEAFVDFKQNLDDK